MPAAHARSASTARRTLTNVAQRPSLHPATPGRETERERTGAVVQDLQERYGQQLFGFARRQGLSDGPAADAVQETLLRLWSQLLRGATIDNPKAWAFQTVYRLAMDQHRRVRRLAVVSNLMEQEPSASFDLEDRIAVWAEVDRLPERQRHVLYLRYRADLPFEDIASVLAISASAARSHAAQAMGTLRRRLGVGMDR
jgi:RNA polymerase sigma factor (sigma-70 family)